MCGLAVTIEVFAEAVGVDVTTARRWLRGAATPDRKFARRLRRLQIETRVVNQV
jgi:DNA-binding transcriptional regulator YiaG